MKGDVRPTHICFGQSSCTTVPMADVVVEGDSEESFSFFVESKFAKEFLLKITF